MTRNFAIGMFKRHIMAVLMIVAVVVSSWPVLTTMAKKWSTDPRYSHGFLVPAFAAFLLWHRRGAFVARPSWWGVVFVAAGVGARVAGSRFYVEWLEGISLLPLLAGLVMLFGGWKGLRWAGPSIAFLIFMIPLPYRVEMSLGYPLQRLGTLASNYLLQTMGLPAVAEGNVIHLNEAKIGVVEACNGLGMLLMFASFAWAVALLAKRPWLDKLIIVLSAVPIALTANIVRIVVTGLLYETAGGHVADAVYHDLAGWLMMPMALGALWVELQLLSRIFVEVEAEDHVPIPVGLGASRNRAPI